MELVLRYLKAIEFWLPAGQKQDILAEISEDLYSQIEEREVALGRPMTEAELEALLKERGRPMLVANRFGTPRYLIGPDWFPTYLLVLKIVGLCYVLPWVAVYFVIYGVQHPVGYWGMAVLEALAKGWAVAFRSAAVVTIVFASLELADRKCLGDWSPRQLAPVRDAFRILRANSVAEIVVGLVFLWFWIGYASTLNPIDGPRLKVTLNPVWMYFFWSYLLVGTGNIALAIGNLRWPYWSTPRAAWRLASDFAGAALFCWLLKANVLASLWIAGVAPEKEPAILGAVRFWINEAFPICVIVSAIAVMVAANRLVRVMRRTGPPLFVLKESPSPHDK